ncbi:MAG: hypothetical protein LBR64_07240 [Dysgonamonadaceae bacterium]|jgi:uncharacterized protein involved in exopolysaccharide biosynthesis|nr:hypothetical protein [Dysgonamonadaceae bacterium]
MEENNKKSEWELIKETVALCFKYWYYFVISMIICGVLGIAYLKLATPVMSVLAKVSLRHDESLVGSSSIGKGSSMLSAFGLGKATENIEDEANKMGSQGYLRNVIKNLDLNKVYIYKKNLFVKEKLYDKSPVRLDAAPAIADTLMRTLIFTFNVGENSATKITMKKGRKTIGKYEVPALPATLQTPYGEFTLSKSEYYDDYKKPMTIKVIFTSYDYMAQVYSDALDIDFERKNSDIINMGMISENVFLAKNVLNALIDNYNREWDGDKQAVSDRTLSYIDERLKFVSDSLKQADYNIKKFKDKYSLTEIEADVEYYLKMSGTLQPAILEAKSQLGMIDVALDFVKDDKNKYSPLPLSVGTASETLPEVIARYNELLQKRNDFYKSGELTSLAKSLDEQIESQRSALIQTMVNIRKGLQVSVGELQKKEAEMNSKIGNVPAIEKDYISLKREQEVQQSIYIFLLEMREESGVKGISLLPKLKVIDPPYVENKPISPSMIKVALIVLFFGGIALPFSAIYGMPYIRAYFRKRKQK